MCECAEAVACVVSKVNLLPSVRNAQGLPCNSASKLTREHIVFDRCLF